MAIKNLTTNKVIAVTSKVANSTLSRSLGLMFSKPQQTALVLKFPSERKISLHMAFVFYPIDVLFVNKKNEITDLKENFRPFTAYNSGKSAMYAIELPAGTIEKSKTKIGHKIGFLKVKHDFYTKNSRTITIVKG